MDAYLRALLQQRQHAHLYRQRWYHDGPQAPLLRVGAKHYLTFCSNDYLGLATHPRLRQALQHGVDTYAVGSGASHLISGHTHAHHLLECSLAHYTQRQRALLFSTGYMANLGVITALLGRQDAVFLDKLNHASLVDAALLSRAQIHRYPHNDMEVLERLLVKTKARHKLIVTDGVFSMEGDIADLPCLVQLAKHHQAWLMVDDAHGLGVMGRTGRGTLEQCNVGVEDVPVLMGTLGKAFGVFGAFVAGSDLLIEALVQLARSYIYTTALPPALAETIRVSLEIAEQETWRRTRLHELIAYFRVSARKRQLPLKDSITPIQPILLGDSQKAITIRTKLHERGIIVAAVRPPTVPQGTARLRITLSALHREEQIDELLDAVDEVLRQLD